MSDVEVYNAIHKAIKAGDLQLVMKLIGEDRSRLEMMTPFGTWLHDAAAHDQAEIAGWFISQGIGIDADGVTVDGAPILYAASEGYLDTVKFLFDRGARLDVSKSDFNPLFAAICGDHTSVAEFLIESGIDISVKYTGDNMKNMDAIAFAKKWGRTEIVNLLKAASQK